MKVDDSRSDDYFFRELKQSYHGLCRFWKKFSIWRYDHCIFVAAEKFLAHEITPKGVGLADPNHPEYRFKPVERDPPVTPREFRSRFYSCYQGGKKHAHRWRQCRHQSLGSADALERIPKRDRMVVEESEKREDFWGLEAVECISFLMFAIYQFLFLIAPFVFWALWLTLWGHNGDLQNASVPLLTAIGLWSLFRFTVFNK
ncbi:hypothetical protein EJ08DRAFT_491691 [Tothia fuscella]|uniref:Uncharacterized protein n=1 Tax=Tothia fuscella TaxID=1048955 RepID=A0A9P4NHF2_9PEZI|nr:hypothetical protein EJ08DRAFT_491691 [Tothia fuscella]